MNEFSGEGKNNNIEPGRKMPDILPKSIRKLALLRSTIVVPIEGERQRIVNFVTLPKDTQLKGTPESVRVDFPVKKDQASREIEVGIVHPGPEDEENIEPTLVVVRQEGVETASFMDGQRYTDDPEVQLAAEFVREHLDDFPPPSIFEES